MTRHIILVGSNIDPEENVPSAIEMVRTHGDMTLLDVSGVYESRAVTASGNVDTNRPSYRNAALLVETTLGENELRSALREIESQLGRRRSDDRYADRTADLDVIATYVPGEVAVTDPSVRELAFVTLPSSEIASDWIVDPDGRTIGDLAQGFKRIEAQIRRLQ